VSAVVEILGTDLTGATSVTFNGTAAEFTVNESGSAITSMVPTGATTGFVSVNQARAKADEQRAVPGAAITAVVGG